MPSITPGRFSPRALAAFHHVLLLQDTLPGNLFVSQSETYHRLPLHRFLFLPQLLDIRDFSIKNAFWEAIFRNAVTEHTTRLGQGFKNCDWKTEPCKMIRSAQTCRARPDNGYFFLSMPSRFFLSISTLPLSARKRSNPRTFTASS